MTAKLSEGFHLIARFFDVLSSRPLTPAEQQEADGLLRSTAERAMFWDQPTADQRHGLGAARFVASSPGSRPELIRAALLHDVGKRHARLGIVGRSVASAVRMLGGSGRGRLAMYLDHGPVAAAELEAAGADEVIVAYARYHHEGPPSGFPADDWTLLDQADRVRR